MAKSKFNAIIVGGGLAGLMAAIKIAEAGADVSLFSLVDAKRSHSVCAQGGVNAAVNTKGEGDSPWIHFQETIYGGDFLANQPPVKEMCEEGPNLIYLLDRMGVMFNRTPEGFLQVEMRGGGTKYSRGLFAGATTGQQMLYALDEQVRRFEAAGLAKRYEGWEFISIVKDSVSMLARVMAMGKMHKVFAITAAIPAAIGAILPNSVVNRLAGGDLPIITEREIISGLPPGVMDLKVDARFEKDGPRIVSYTVGRTARKILDGRVYISAGVYVSGK